VQPRQIIDALLECDPLVDQDAKVAFSPSDPQAGAAMPVLSKQAKAVNKRMLKEHYHRLGANLHAPVDLRDPDIKKWSSDLGKVIECLHNYTADQVLINVRPLVQIQCACGRTIKRNRRALGG
jgi:hypothetical protein